ncbi:MAG: hypothetical protein KGL10_04755 [Alphaproteobacteria bacterium]|nr:hypothetical protein [Alphaproteobacteria bacterium]
MGISGIGSSYTPTSYQPPSLSAGPASAGNNAFDAAMQAFDNLMKESPIQRLEDQWLKAHGLTRAQFEKLPPAQKEALMKEMAQDIENQVKQQAASKHKSGATDIMV